MATDECTSDEWLRLAIDVEEMAKNCGVFDPAFEGLTRMKIDYLQRAISAERTENARK